MITFHVETFLDTIEEAAPLLFKHWEEIAPDTEKCVLKPDLASYMALEKAGMLLLVTARDEGALIGYVLSYIHPHSHYTDLLVSTEDLHFILPEYRKGWLGVKLFKFLEKELKARGVAMSIVRTKIKHNHGKIFERLGYNPMDINYCKFLEQE